MLQISIVSRGTSWRWVTGQVKGGVIASVASCLKLADECVQGMWEDLWEKQCPGQPLSKSQIDRRSHFSVLPSARHIEGKMADPKFDNE